MWLCGAARLLPSFNSNVSSNGSCHYFAQPSPSRLEKLARVDGAYFAERHTLKIA